MPPRQVELPVVRSDSAVELAFAPVLPKKVCRWDSPVCPGKTIGSSKAMCEVVQTVRNAPSLLGAISAVDATLSVAEPVAGATILVVSMKGINETADGAGA